MFRFGVLAVIAVTALLGSCSDSGGSDDDGSADATSDGDTRAPPTPDADVVLSVSDGDPVATLDDRYQSYNVEMVEVTGGEFWKPYDSGPGKVVREPIDLGSERLRNLASALGPAYIRVSGTWANSTYFDADGTSGGVAPEGFQGVLSTDQWRGVGEFADAVDGEVVTSFASNTGVRDADGVWTDDQARALLEFSIEEDLPLVAAEFYNEPGFNIGVPQGHTEADFGRDFAIFTTMVDEVMPDLRIAGPGSADDVTPVVIEPPLDSTDVLETVDPSEFDIFSYHFYPKVSERCISPEGSEVALTEEFLSRVEADKAHYEELRDLYVPGAPMWITETAQAACGGDRWAAQYVDVIRYVDVLGRLATGDGDVVFHNTLAASDYGLIDEDDLTPRPSYWAAVLWQKLMGPQVLTVDPEDDTPDLGIYAQCTPDADEPSVTYTIVNSSANDERTVTTATGEATVYVLTGDSLDSEMASLNGTVLTAAEDGTLPPLEGEAASGAVAVPPASVAFVVEPTGVPACA